MTGFAVLCLVLSAAIHAGWNFVGKRRRPTSAFFLVANLAGAIVMTIVAGTSVRSLGRLPREVWLCLVITGAAQGAYYAGLAAAYRRGDLSVVYPLVRSAPVVLVAIASFLLGHGDRISGPCIAGMAMVVAGTVVLPLARFRDWRPRRYVEAGTLFALIAALGTVAYSLVDDAALRILRPALAPELTTLRATLLYAALESWTASLALAALVVLTPDTRRELRDAWTRAPGDAAMVGVGIYAAYALVLLAMAYARNVSYIVAFRQLGIPFSAMLGLVILREPHPPPKLTGIALILAGLALVATG